MSYVYFQSLRGLRLTTPPPFAQTPMAHWWGINGYRVCHQFRLLLWTLYIGQFVHPVGKEWLWVSLEYMKIWCIIQVIYIYGWLISWENQTRYLSNNHYFSVGKIRGRQSPIRGCRALGFIEFNEIPI